MTGFLIAIGAREQPVACTRTLRDAYALLESLPRGLVTISFDHDGEAIRLARYTHMIDIGWSIVSLA